MDKSVLIITVLACLLLPAFSVTCFCDCANGDSQLTEASDLNSARTLCLRSRMSICPGSAFNDVRCVNLTSQQVIWIGIGSLAVTILLIILCCYCCCRAKHTKNYIYQPPSAQSSGIAYVQYTDHPQSGHHNQQHLH